MDNIILSSIEDKIIIIRSKQVILDYEVAALYDVETKEINQALKNNPDKFPQGFVVEINKEELNDLRSKFLTTKLLKTRSFPKAFTEQGLYMLATILKSKKATQTTLSIVRNLHSIQETTDKVIHKKLLQKSGNLMNDLLFKDLQETSSETSVEFNLGLMKVKHQVKTEKPKVENIHNLEKLIETLIQRIENQTTEIEYLKQISSTKK
jgi:hypothetical protein